MAVKLGQNCLSGIRYGVDAAGSDLCEWWLEPVSLCHHLHESQRRNLEYEPHSKPRDGVTWCMSLVGGSAKRPRASHEPYSVTANEHQGNISAQEA
jgi:hypothetical protein